VASSEPYLALDLLDADRMIVFKNDYAPPEVGTERHAKRRAEWGGNPLGLYAGNVQDGVGRING
jgi:hypothetical protein